MKDKNCYTFDDFIADESFCKFVKGLNFEGKETWEKWFQDNPPNLETAEEAKLVITKLHFKENKLTTNFVTQEWAKVEKKIKSTKKGKSIGLRPIHKQVLQYAAAIILLFSVIGTIFFSNVIFEKEKAIVYTEINVPNGQIKQILLPDSSLVTINSGSKVIYADNFGENERRIKLEGEAFFDVKRNTSKPFVVQTETNEVTVLGTAFNVMSYSDEKIYKIALEHGKVKVTYKDGKPEYLKPNQVYLLLKDKQHYKIYQTNNITENSKWKEGKIVLKNQQFVDIAKKLQRTHNYVFQINNPQIKKKKYTGAFHVNDSITKILKVIQASTPFAYKIESDTIIIN